MTTEAELQQPSTQGGLGYTFVNRAEPLTNNAVYPIIAVFQTATSGIKVKIVKRVSPGTYDVVLDEAITGSATVSWDLVTLTNAYTVPATGTYYAAAYYPAAGTMGTFPSQARAYVAADVTGTGQSLTEDTNPTGAVRALLSNQASADMDTVVSTFGGNWNVANVTAGNLPVGVTAGVANAIVGTFNEAARNIGTTADKILTGNYITIQGVTTNGTFDEAARNQLSATANQILVGASVKVQNVTTTGTFDENARNVDPGANLVANGTAYVIHGANLVGTYAGGGGTNANFVISSQGGNWDDANVVAGNLKSGVTAGVANAIVGTYGAGTPGFDLIYWENGPDNDLIPRNTALDINYPTVTTVVEPTVYGYANQYTGTFAATPQTQMPNVVAVDLQTGDAARVTITDSDPVAVNSIYTTVWGQNGVQEWELQGNIIGDGTFDIDKPLGLYGLKVISHAAGFGIVTAIGNLFYITDSSNVTRNRIRDAVANSALKICYKLGFQADYQSPGRDAFKIWCVYENMSNGLDLTGGEIGSGITLHAPRQADFPPSDGFIPGSRVGIAGRWYAVNVQYPTETVEYAPTFTLTLHRLDDITVEVDGIDV